MKFSIIFLAGITSAAETDESAVVTLNKLLEISLEISSADFGINRAKWTQKWTQKFRNNSIRMSNSFQQCGTKWDSADDEIDVEYDIDNPCGAIRELFNGFSSWTTRYISNCRGQKKKSHQQNRLQKWNNMWNKGKKVQIESELQIAYLWFRNVISSRDFPFFHIRKP